MITDTPEDRLPLAGITVVALEQAVAGPIATRHLADLGARVIKLERVDEGDFARNYDTAVNGLAAYFVWANRSKESVEVDLKSSGGLEIARRLIAEADIFVQNSAPGVAERLGLDADTLRAEHPSLIVVNISGYGTSGPMRDRKAYDLLVQAESGITSVTGTAENPAKSGVPSADLAAGVDASIAALAALNRRWRTGEGATIDISMFDAAVEWMGYAMYTQLYTGKPVPRMGLSHASIAPYDAYPTSDGSIVIGVQNDRGWRKLVTDVFERPDMEDHADFRTNPLRVAHRAECDAFVASETAKWTTADLDLRLAEHGIPAAQLNDMAAVVEHPQLSARDRWRTVKTEAGDIQALLPPFTFRDVELRMDPVPALGEHTDAITRHVMGETATAAARNTDG